MNRLSLKIAPVAMVVMIVVLLAGGFAVQARSQDNTQNQSNTQNQDDVKTPKFKRTKKPKKAYDLSANPLAGVQSKQPDKELYDKAMVAMKKGRYDVARLDLQTLLNTY